MAGVPVEAVIIDSGCRPSASLGRVKVIAPSGRARRGRGPRCRLFLVQSHRSIGINPKGAICPFGRSRQSPVVLITRRVPRPQITAVPGAGSLLQIYGTEPLPPLVS